MSKYSTTTHGQMAQGGHPVCGTGAGNGRFVVPATRKSTKIEHVTCSRCLKVFSAYLGAK